MPCGSSPQDWLHRHLSGEAVVVVELASAAGVAAPGMRSTAATSLAHSHRRSREPRPPSATTGGQPPAGSGLLRWFPSCRSYFWSARLSVTNLMGEVQPSTAPQLLLVRTGEVASAPASSTNIRRILGEQNPRDSDRQGHVPLRRTGPGRVVQGVAGAAGLPRQALLQEGLWRTPRGQWRRRRAGPRPGPSFRPQSRWRLFLRACAGRPAGEQLRRRWDAAFYPAVPDQLTDHFGSPVLGRHVQRDPGQPRRPRPARPVLLRRWCRRAFRSQLRVCSGPEGAHLHGADDHGGVSPSPSGLQPLTSAPASIRAVMISECPWPAATNSSVAPLSLSASVSAPAFTASWLRRGGRARRKSAKP